MPLRPSLEDTHLAMLKAYAARSTCARRQVAALITDAQGRLLGAGYNGVPRGVIHCTDFPCPGAQGAAGDTRACEAVHAEINALLQCSNLREAYTIYCSCTPCFECAKAICNTSIVRVVVTEPYADARGYQMLKRGGKQVIVTNFSNLAGS